MRKICCLFFLLYLFPLKIISQTSEPVFKHYSIADGLPSSQIYQVIQDKQGYLWFGTDHGLVKYNGYEFKIFTSANGLLDNTVFKLFIDNKNRLWMQTFSGQLFFVENDKLISYKYNNKIIELVKNNIPKGFYIDNRENVYFTCGAIGEYKIDTAGNFKKQYSNYINKNFNQIFIDEIDSTHYLTSGYISFNKDIPIQIYLNNLIYSNDTLSRLMNDYGQIFLTRKHDGKLLIILSKYIFEFNNGKMKLLEEFPDYITNTFEDKENNFWVSTYLGLYVCDVGFNKSKRISYLKNEFITGTIQDNENGFWITTLNSGVYYLNSIQIKNYIIKSSELDEPMCINNDKKSIYACFRNGKISQINSDTIKTIWKFPTNSIISHIFCDSLTNKIYFSKIAPGYLFENKYTSIKGSENMSFKGNYILRKNGEIVNATANGIYKIRGDSIYSKYSLSQRANCIFENENSELLIGCNNGIFSLNEISGETKLYNISFKNVRVDDINQIKAIVCIATRGNGLGLIFKNEVKYINESNGLCSNIIHHIVISGNNIWCATYNGLSKIEFLNFEPLRYKITNIGIHEGIPNNEINDLIIVKDTVWIASKTAISYFNQNNDFINKTPPLVHLTSFIINSIDTLKGDDLKLPFSSNNIIINFDALSFKSDGNIFYRYYLVHETDTFTSETNDRHVEFLSLTPGKYTFNVTAKNSSGIWSNATKEIRFVILNPFWKTTWFISISCMLILLVIYFIFKNRIRRIKNEEALKTTFNKQIMLLEIKALRAQMNPHFIFNVINSIQDYISKSDSKSAQRYLTKFAKLIRLILDNSFEGEVLLSEEIKANELYIELEQLRFEDKFDFIFEIDEEIDIDSLIIPSMIIQPFLENAIKHGLRHLDKKGKLKLLISKTKIDLIIIIEDNGIGRHAADEWNKGNLNEHISRGSYITSKRVEAYNKAHNTTIELAIIDLDNGSKGTRVELKIPIKYRNFKGDLI